MADDVNIFDMFETDLDAEEDGRWFDLGGDNRIKIRRFTSKKSQEVRTRLEKPYRKTHRSGNLPEKVTEAITEKQLAHAIVADWELVDRAGEEIPFSPEACLKLFKELPNLKNEVAALAIDMDNFRIEEKEETEKN